MFIILQRLGYPLFRKATSLPNDGKALFTEKDRRDRIEYHYHWMDRLCRFALISLGRDKFALKRKILENDTWNISKQTSINHLRRSCGLRDEISQYFSFRLRPVSSQVMRSTVVIVNFWHSSTRQLSADYILHECRCSSSRREMCVQGTSEVDLEHVGLRDQR